MIDKPKFVDFNWSDSEKDSVIFFFNYKTVFFNLFNELEA